MTKAHEYGEYFKQISDALEKNTNNSLRHNDLTVSQVCVLMHLNASPDHSASMKDIEKALHVSQPATAGVVKRLEQKGFIITKPGKDDRRVKIVTLSPLGKASCEEGNRIKKASEEEMLSVLTEAEQEQLYELLTKLCEKLS